MQTRQKIEHGTLHFSDIFNAACLGFAHGHVTLTWPKSVYGCIKNINPKAVFIKIGAAGRKWTHL